MPDLERSKLLAPDQPLCPKCRLPMQWKRTRRTFTEAGVNTVVAYACDDCDQVAQRSVS